PGRARAEITHLNRSQLPPDGARSTDSRFENATSREAQAYPRERLHWKLRTGDIGRAPHKPCISERVCRSDLRHSTDPVGGNRFDARGSSLHVLRRIPGTTI